jgi:hypothetical protein
MLKHNKKLWFDDDCSKLRDESKQVKLQLWQNPNQINGYNLKNLRRETSRTFRINKREYLKGKINEHETNIKKITDLYRGINEFKKGYQLRMNIIKDENSNLLADP